MSVLTNYCTINYSISYDRWLYKWLSVTESILFTFCDLFIIPTHPVTHNSPNHPRPTSKNLEFASNYFLLPTCFYCNYFLHIYFSTKQNLPGIQSDHLCLYFVQYHWTLKVYLFRLYEILFTCDWDFIYSSFLWDYYMRWIHFQVFTQFPQMLLDSSRHTTQPWHLASSTAMFNNSSSVCRMISYGSTSSSW